jgi:asparagine synthase (glutamine-hydrolysing)
MSAIFGIYNLDGGRVSGGELGDMSRVLTHRGEDRAEIWHGGAVGLGHRMFCVTPESLEERLPRSQQDVPEAEALTITADARLDNREELISQLSVKRDVVTDSQLILAAYEKWGEACPERLLGDFAFAIWDGRTRKLFCARDHAGVRPFFYHHSHRAFVFASEIRALFHSRVVRRQLNEVRIADFLAGLYDDNEITFYQDIVKLPAAHSISVDRNRKTLRQYWRLDPIKELHLNSDEEYAERFRELFEQAVACRLRSAFPVGSMLSGGLDSSAVTCVASKTLRRTSNKPLHTFSADYRHVKECSERYFIDKVLAQEDPLSAVFYADEASPFTSLDEAVWYEDEPLNAPNLYLQAALYGVARERGVRVILDGFDGDTTVSHGTMYMAELARAGRWIRLASEIAGYRRDPNISARTLIRDYAWEYGLGSKPWLNFVAKAIRSAGHRMAAYTGPAKKGPSRRLLNPDFVKRIGWRERRSALQKRAPLTEREDHLQRLEWPLMSYYFEVIDRAAAAHSVEVRYPFADKRLVEFCLSVPANQKMHNGWTRMIMRRAMKNILPPEVQWRIGKSNLSPSIRRGLAVFEGERIKQMLFHESAAIEEYVDIDALRRYYERFVHGGEAIAIWRALSLGVWLKKTGHTAKTSMVA